MKETDLKDRWILYIITSVLIHGAILSIPITMKAPHSVEPIRIFVLDGNGFFSQGGGGVRHDKLQKKPYRNTSGRTKKEKANVPPSPHFARPVEHSTEPLPLQPTYARIPDNELSVRNNESVDAPLPETGTAVAGEQAVPGQGAGGSGVDGASIGTGKGGGGTGVGSGFGLGDGSGGGEGVGFGSPGGPRFLSREVPEYPYLARRRKKEGSVLLMVAIDAAGKLTRVDVIEASDKIFVEPSLKAVRKSTFLPARRNNQPVDCKALLPIKFLLTE